MRGPQSQLHKHRAANTNSWRDNINSSVECTVSQTRVTVQHSADIATQDCVKLNYTQLNLLQHSTTAWPTHSDTLSYLTAPPPGRLVTWPPGWCRARDNVSFRSVHVLRTNLYIYFISPYRQHHIIHNGTKGQTKTIARDRTAYYKIKLKAYWILKTAILLKKSTSSFKFMKTVRLPILVWITRPFWGPTERGPSCVPGHRVMLKCVLCERSFMLHTTCTLPRHSATSQLTRPIGQPPKYPACM